MFSLLLDLVGASIVGFQSSTGTWIVSEPGQIKPTPKPASPLAYEDIMHGNAVDGVRFIKPKRGHEDGCINGVCNELRHDEYLS